ncbi:hypothetical protein GCM10018790_15090 [Kitasatospora xanthocidica]|uniref:DUF6328 family protein n=1 Tax=Kitasatospora xanthocidica TaxID=83382 RepID=UPI00167609B9|nr:DUF6328 family protein [Kitasatospora xanthocidica]GHF38379.1 hypothetical protein GCM10018790_15090 [Kitasatospora xanthocidica]
MTTPETGRGGPGRLRTGRRESPEERADRCWVDLLQEVRVAQTGAQVLFGFLLSVVFMPRFAQLGGFDRGLYVATVVLGALATGALTAPVAYHRIFAGRHLKPQLVDAAARLVATGLVLLALTIGSALLLLLRVATGSAAAGWIAGAVMLWFLSCWLVLPVQHVRRHDGHSDRPPPAAGHEVTLPGQTPPGADGTAPVTRGVRAMGTENKLRNAAEKATGKVKEAAGRATGDRTIEAKGRAQQAKSDVKQAMEKIKDAGKA